MPITRFDFQRNEFVLSFPDALLARKYQSHNREGRIYEDENEQLVYIPKPKGIKSIGASNGELAVHFENEKEAGYWCKKIGVGYRNERSNLVVYIRRD